MTSNSDFERLEKIISAKFENLETKLAMSLTEIKCTLEILLADNKRLEALVAAKKKAASTKAATDGTTTTASADPDTPSNAAEGTVAKFPNNKLNWFKNKWRTTPEFRTAMMTVPLIAETIAKDAKIATKNGDVKVTAEATAAWNCIKGDAQTLSHIETQFIKEKDAFMKANTVIAPTLTKEATAVPATASILAAALAAASTLTPSTAPATSS